MLDRRLGLRGGILCQLTWSHLFPLGLTWVQSVSLKDLPWSRLTSLGQTWIHLVSCGLTLVSLGLTYQ